MWMSRDNSYFQFDMGLVPLKLFKSVPFCFDFAFGTLPSKSQILFEPSLVGKDRVSSLVASCGLYFEITTSNILLLKS